MHHMLFQCILDLWGLLLFSRTLPRITGWNEVSKDQFRPMPAVGSVERPSPDERKSRCNYNKAVALKQQLPEPQSSKRKLSGLVPRSFLFIQDPKQRHDTAQSLQPPVQTHPCKEYAPHSWDKTSLNCDETICPSIYVPNQMHHMLFQCIVDLWGLLLFSCTIAQVIRPRKFPNHQFRPCLPAARKSGCQLVQLEQIYWFQRYPKSKCVLIFYYPIIAVDLWRNHLSQHVPACAYLGITLPGHGLALCV